MDSLAGVGNFHQVDPGIYRGAQPSDEGLRNLAQLGVKTIIDLRHGKERGNEQKTAEEFGLHYVNVPMEGLTPPTDEQIASLLALFDGAADKGPVFVHCREGKDRTGAVVATYRIARDHWTNEKALAEAKSFGMSPLQKPRQNYILKFPAS